MLWGVFALKCFVFQKFDFSRFSIDRICLSTNRNCDKNFGLNLPSSIGIQSIEYQSSQADSNQNFYHNFDRSRDRFDWSKIWKNQIFEKQSNFMQKLLKAWYDEYEMKCFSKTLVLNPDLPKKKIFFQSMFLKSQSLNTFCIKIKEFSILDGQNNITHNNMYKV